MNSLGLGGGGQGVDTLAMAARGRLASNPPLYYEPTTGKDFQCRLCWAHETWARDERNQRPRGTRKPHRRTSAHHEPETRNTRVARATGLTRVNRCKGGPRKLTAGLIVEREWPIASQGLRYRGFPGFSRARALLGGRSRAVVDFHVGIVRRPSSTTQQKQLSTCWGPRIQGRLLWALVSGRHALRRLQQTGWAASRPLAGMVGTRVAGVGRP